MMRSHCVRFRRPILVPCLAATLALLALPGPLRAAPAVDGAAEAFRLRQGPEWELTRDPASGRVRRVSGGALKWLDEADLAADARTVESLVLGRARAFLRENADLLELDFGTLHAAEIPVIAAGGRLLVVRFDVAPWGVPVDGAHVVLAVSGGSLIYGHLIGTEAVSAHPTPRVSDEEAIELALTAAGLARADLRSHPQPVRSFLREGTGHRLAWIVPLIERAGPKRWIARIDGQTGALVSLTDETIAACDPVPMGGSQRRVLGAVRPESATDAERVELLPRALVGPATGGVDGFFAPPGAPYAGALDGPAARVDCVDCLTPSVPAAPAGPSGDVDFGSGGTNHVGNGASTPSDRASYFHAEAAQRAAGRWLGVPWITAPLTIKTNIPSACNAFWDGASLNFFRSSARCANTGEIRDVIQHEWGHGLDGNDGMPTPSLSVDGATGEAVGDLVAMLRSRDACIGEGFFLSAGDFPSNSCSGVRDLDEKSPGHELGSPATLSLGNVAAKCPASAFYRGPAGREGHCEGEILGQACWHLVQNLLTGMSYADATPLPGGALPVDEAWEVLERLFYASRPFVASYAPMAIQSLGTSAYDAFLVADDTGDGLANGTPHASAIHEAFAHHGITESPTALPDSANCTAPADPVLSAMAPVDPATGLPAVEIAWADVGATSYHLLRADGPSDSYLPIAPPFGPGAGVYSDRGVLPGRSYLYRVVAEAADGCLSPGATPLLGAAGPLLRLSALRLDDTIGGNGDLLLEEGEQADVWIDLANDGSGPASNVNVSLASSDPLVAIVVGGPVAYGTIAPGATVPGPSAFRVSALPGAPRFVFLVASGDADEGCLRGQWLLEIARPDLFVAGQTVDDSVVGDTDGSWEPGETIDFDVLQRNDGLLGAPNVTGVLALRTPVPGVTIARPAASWGTIGAAATTGTQPPPFSLVAAPGLGPRTPVPLTLAVSVDGVLHRTTNLDLTVGGLPQGTREWSSQGATTSPTPIILQLTDDDMDGLITRCDTPDVVVGHWASDLIRAFSGADGSLLWEVGVSPCIRFNAFGAFAGGDIDNDGRNEIVFGDLDEYICTLRDDGSLFWKTAAPVRSGGAGAVPQVWDLDGDGNVEVVAGHTMLNGVDGSIKWEQPFFLTSRTLVVDLDLDGQLEVIAGSKTWRSDGTLYPAVFGDMGVCGAVGNFDDDPYPEIVSLGSGATRGQVRVMEHDGTLKWTRTDLPGALGGQGPPCVGDFDSDGYAEIGVPTEFLFYALDHDGTTMWTSPISDDSGASGCSVFDLDGDGPPEILYRDEGFVYAYDGLSGTTLWSAVATSGTGYEYPQAVDIDGDGLVEILVTGGTTGSPGALHAFGHPDWPSARRVWNQEDYSVTHVEEDGSIPADVYPRWLSGNDFRGQQIVCPCDGPAPTFAAVRDCDVATACFTASIDGGRAPIVLSWDFGDGSAPGTGPTPCHTYAGPGNYPVLLSVRDRNTCIADSGRIVRVGEPLSVAASVTPACEGTPSCFTATVSAGVGPFDVQWDFDDGSSLEAGTAPCHAFAAGAYLVTVFVRDAAGCLAEFSLPVAIEGPGTLLEVSAPGAATPLRIARRPLALLGLTFEARGGDAGVYRGTLAGLHSTGYDHASTGACRLAAGGVTLPEPVDDSYFLVVGAACDLPRLEGSYGRDSFGLQRPSAATLGRAVCP